MMTLVRNQPLAEEITQNTFYRAMTSKKTFSQRSGELTWLCSIAKHLAADEYRKTWKTAELDEAAAVSGGRDLCPASDPLFRGPHERRRTVPAAFHPHHFRALRAAVSFCDPGACAAARTVG